MATKASQWKTKAPVQGISLELPSGNVCLARPVRPEAFLESGMIPDALSGMIASAINSKKGLPPSKIEEITEDPAKMAAALELFDRALVFVVVEPQVEMPPICDAEGCTETYAGGQGVHISRKHPGYHKYVDPARDPDILYADVVDMEDKQFIFQWAIGGSTDVSRFRDELESELAALQPGEGVAQDSR